MREADERIRNELLRILYDNFEEKPFGTWNVRDIIDQTMDNLDVEENDVRYVIKRISEDRLVDFTGALGGGGTIEIEAKGVEILQRERGETFLQAEKWSNLLEFLYQTERESPQDSRVTPEEILAETDIEEDGLDYIIWYSDKKGWAEVHYQIGGDRPYWGVEITNYGRQICERELQ